MRLSKIKLAGFKSFVDPTTIHLPSSLVGIIGPNGCGKSNVIDAVRWVMGESSARHLRGDSMADVIFNGSSARKPVGHASVELGFDNTDGSMGGQYASYSEISLRRQVSRDGQSVYYLNGTRCRRKDITDIFLGTGLGPRSYAIIEQGMISRLIEARPEELRIFLEEAAGISKYKERRRETETRIRHTRENLDRLIDLLEEIEKQLDRLKRQAKTAERFKELKQQERRVRAELLALRYQQLHADSEADERKIRERETAMQAVLAEQRAVEASLERGRESLTGANDRFGEVQGRFYELGAEVARLEQSIQHARESRQQNRQELDRIEQTWSEIQAHIELDQRRLRELTEEIAANAPALGSIREQAEVSGAALHRAEEAMHDWQADWDDFNHRAAAPAQAAQVERTRIDHLERQLDQLDQRLTRIAGEQQHLTAATHEQQLESLEQRSEEGERTAARLQDELASTSARIADLRVDIRRQADELDQIRSRQQRRRGRLVSLETLQQAALGQQTGEVTEWLKSQGLDDAPRLAQQLDVEPGWERAVETVLGFYLEAVCIDGFARLAGVLGRLEHGALTLFDTSAACGTDAGPEALVPLASKVRAPWSLSALMGDVYVAEDLSGALAVRDALPDAGSVITREGVWIGKGWLRVARDADERAGVLEREREINELKAESGELERLCSEQQKTLERSRAVLEDLERSREHLQAELNQAHRDHGEVRAQMSAGKARLEQLRSRSETIRKEAEELGAQQVRDRSELSAARQRLEDALSEMAAHAVEREERARHQAELRAALDEVRNRAQQDREAVHELVIKAESMRTAHSTTEQNLERMFGQRAHLLHRREELQQALQGAEAPMEALAEELEQMLARRIAVEGELSQARRRVEEIEHRLRELEQSRAAREQQVQEIRERLEQDRMAWQEIRTRCQTLLEQLGETGYQPESLLGEIAQGASVEEWIRELERLEQRIQRLGPINLAAIEEFEEQSERKQYLDAQHADLTEALQTLEGAINKIDRETRARFRETFDRVNGGLKDKFPRLFGGGHAYLELVGEDLLDTGITVMARPPGKRNSTIHLLSGGEKALTAVALVFSIFDLNPSPFCMLDEVDAPLDDANVGRFCDLVREMSDRVQFIIITHNKITMELSNQLSGVTMNEPGVSRLVAVDIDEAVQMAAM
jgi:chromosome segregation protein